MKDRIAAKSKQYHLDRTKRIDDEQGWSGLWCQMQQIEKTESRDFLLTHGCDDVIVNREKCGFGRVVYGVC